MRPQRAHHILGGARVLARELRGEPCPFRTAREIRKTSEQLPPSPSRWQVGGQNTMILNLTPGTQSSGFAAEKADLGAPAASEVAALERDRLEKAQQTTAPYGPQKKEEENSKKKTSMDIRAVRS